MLETVSNFLQNLNLLDSIAIMGKGMLGIFIVTGIVVLCVTALNSIPEKKDKK